MSSDWNVAAAPYEHRSVCMVQPMDGYHTWMKRLADIAEDGTLHPFFQDAHEPSRYGNRDMLFRKDGPERTGVVGVWDWYAEPHRERHWEDYVHCRYVPGLSPIEIHVVSDCHDVDSLIARLKCGIAFEPTVERFLLCCAQGSHLLGLLCAASDMTFVEDKLVLTDHVNFLPEYVFSRKDDILLTNERRYFKNLELGNSVDVVSVKKLHEIVKSVVLNEVSWKKLKERGATREQQQKFKSFLSQLSGMDLVEKISAAGQVSEGEASSALKSFIAHAETYIDGASIEDEILTTLLQTNDVVRARCMGFAAEEWAAENAARLRTAEAELAAKNAECCVAEERKESCRMELEELEYRKEILLSAVEEQKKFAREVEQHVAERIRRAQENAAEFIAEVAFMPHSNHDGHHVLELPAHGSVSFQAGVRTDGEEPEENADWKNTLETIESELQSAGVADDLTRDVAAYLYAAYVLRLPLFITGPNSDCIADALSVSLCGKTCGRLHLDGAFDTSVLDVILSSADEIIRIENPLAHEWHSFLPSVTAHSEKVWIATHPFSEDLQLEPQGLFHYFLPMCTELFVDHATENHYVGGYRARDYQAFPVVKKADRRRVRTISAFPMPPLMRQHFALLHTNMDVMLGRSGDENTDTAVLFFLLPYAYVTGQMERLGEMLEQKTCTLSETRKKMLSWLMGDLS